MPFYPPFDDDKVKGIRPPTISERFPSIAPRSPEEEAILGSISDVESSGGADLGHAVIQDPNSMHHGQAAVGRYGMMPESLVTAVKRAQHNETLSPQLSQLIGASPEDLANSVKQDPVLEDEFATRLLRSMPDEASPQEKNFMWQFGNNANLKNMDKRMAPERASKFGESFRKRMSPKPAAE